MSIRRAGALLVLSLFALSITAQTAPPRVRLNIDDPSFNLALYKKAIQKLKDRDADPSHHDDPNDATHNGYKYFEELHNGAAGVSTCQHQNEIFLTWHRALLSLFEQALQATYPGETDNLMLPYWNWGAKASGIELPKAFEDKTSPLYLSSRDPGGAGRTYTNDVMRVTILQTTTWRGFNGGECVLADCAGKPCAKCTAKYGAFENPYHNQMHNWVGGPMLEDTTAAEDPIFWSFHAYVDLAFDCWQRTHNDYTVGCPDCPLRALPGNWTADKTKSTAALGYTYDFANTVCAQRTFAPRTLMAAAHVKKTTPFVVDFTIPKRTFATAHIRVDGLPVFPDYNYSAHVFLYPATVTLAPRDAAFRRQYFVDDIAVWGLGDGEHGAHHASVTADVDATTELEYLAKKSPGAHWKIALVVERPNPQFASTRKGASAEILREIAFDHLTLVYDRDYTEGAQ
jgi:hypothetical protein